jgi:hypothetical protein
MILWMTRDAFSAAILGFVVIVLFVGYNSARHFRKRLDSPKPPRDRDRPSTWN